MKRILIAVDFSGHAAVAARLGAALARRWGAEVALVHTLHLLEHAAVAPAAAERHRTDSLARAQADLAVLRDELLASPGRPIDVQLIARSAEPVLGILGFAAGWQPDLIVCGSHGNGPDRFLLGSVAMRLCRDARCPVLVARADHAARLPADGLFRAPLVAVDYSRFSAPAVTLAAALAAPDSTIELVHIVATDALGEPGVSEALGQIRAEETERLEHFVRGIDVAPVVARCRADVGRVGAQLVSLIERSKVDIVIIGAHGRDTATEIVGTVADRVLRGSPAPVIVLPEGSLGSA